MTHPFWFRRLEEQQLELLNGRNWGDRDEPVKFEQGYIRAPLTFFGPKWRTEPLTEEELALYHEVQPYLDRYFPPVYHDDGVLVLQPHSWLAARQKEARARAEAERQERHQRNVFDWWRADNGIAGALSERQQQQAWRKAEFLVGWCGVDLDHPIQPQIAHLTTKTNWRPGCWDRPEYHVEALLPEEAGEYAIRHEKLDVLPSQSWHFEDEANKKPKKRKKAKKAKKQAGAEPRPSARSARVTDEELDIVMEQLASGMPMTEVSETLNQYLIEQDRPTITRPGLRYILAQRRLQDGQG
jgi:hypothetical protein